MKVSLHVISNSEGLHEIEDVWNSLVNECSESPNLLSGFIKQFMDFDRSSRWSPLVLVISVDNKIVGILPFKTKKKFGA